MGTLIKNNLQTPIEIALNVDSEGRTTAKKLYEFLELDTTHYTRWCKINILENAFAEENIDYEVLAIKGENPQGGRPSQDYKLTATFAKKLAMGCQNKRGDEARQYFIQVEDLLKETVKHRKLPEITQIQQQLTEAKIRNARAGQASIWLKIADKIDIPEYKQICTSYASGVLSGVDNIIPLPEQKEKYYTATEVGKLLGLNKTIVGSIANQHGLKTEEYGKWYHDKSPYSAKEVDTFKYNEKAISKFKELVGA